MKSFSSSGAVRPWKYVCESRSLSFALAKRGAAWVASCRNAYSTGARAPLSQSPDMRFRRYVIPTAFSRANSTLSEAQANDRKPAPEQRAAMTSRVQLTADSIGQRTYGSFWLRDNCQCSKCINPETRQRSVNTFAIPDDIRAENINYGPENVQIHWSDGHDGIYPYSWLATHRMRKAYPASRRSLTFRPFVSVKPQSEFLPTVSYDQVMTNDKGVLKWLEQIQKWGFCLVKGVPVDPESTKTLLERIAFIRHTHYGGFWDFTSDLTFKDTAYTSEFLDAHTDTTYFTDPARLQLFHLLSHTDGEGGSSLLVDGFKAAAVMMKEKPWNCEILSTYPQPFHSSGNENVCIQPISHFPVFNRDPITHRLYQIRWNNYDRAAKMDWEVWKQRQWYSAAKHWNEIISRPEMRIWTQLEPGTALIFDNWRMLHGRSEFTGKRRMCGGYINNDDFVSRYRLLKFGRERALNYIGKTPDPLDITWTRQPRKRRTNAASSDSGPVQI